ncbi:MAG TPA: hypothetical protein PK029_01575 [Bacteroidales bacterium]|nr:MAG: hypothetical protein BWY22_00395 [Bacteroidetes bacterium ADurb.Bin217]HPH15831.1 hypothetical protein [Bacteroidales bacterium]
MKAFSISTFLVFLSFCVIGQNNDLLPKALRLYSFISIDSSYSNKIISFDSTYTPIKVCEYCVVNGYPQKYELQYQSFTPKKNKSFGYFLFDNVEKYSIQFYNLYPDKSIVNNYTYDGFFWEDYSFKNLGGISSEDLFYSFGGSIDTILIEKENGEIEYKQITNPMRLENIKYIDCIEDLYFNKNNFSFNSTIKGYRPIMEYEKNGENRKKATLWIINNPEIELNKKNMVLIGQSNHEVLLFNFDALLKYFFENYSEIEENVIVNNENPFLNEYVKKTLFTSLFENIENKALKPIDFVTNEPISFVRILRDIGYSKDTISNINANDEEELYIIERNGDLQYYKSIIFTENIYLDPKTLNMKKEIVAISPVIWKFSKVDDKSVHIQKKIAFKVYLN